jgi:hypothetical protein
MFALKSLRSAAVPTEKSTFIGSVIFSQGLIFTSCSFQSNQERFTCKEAGSSLTLIQTLKVSSILWEFLTMTTGETLLSTATLRVLGETAILEPLESSITL